MINVYGLYSRVYDTICKENSWRNLDARIQVGQKIAIPRISSTPMRPQ
jgi:hypothetical protein